MGQAAWRKASGAAKTVMAPGHLASGGARAEEAAARLFLHGDEAGWAGGEADG